MKTKRKGNKQNQEFRENDECEVQTELENCGKEALMNLKYKRLIGNGKAMKWG